MSTDMLYYEGLYRTQGYGIICGVDEAGRGPLAGPVCAAAVILTQDVYLDGVNDSKKLSEKRREALYDVITSSAVSWAVGWASREEIDEINILNATFLAMNRAIDGLSVKPDIALIDGNRNSGIACNSQCIIGGDGLSLSIAAASIIAKVSRDRLMLELDKKYPQYGFAAHKGYGTKAHYAALREHGLSPEHRMTFLKNL